MNFDFNDAAQREAAMAAKWAECAEENADLRQHVAVLRELRQIDAKRLAAFQSAVEHVTEDGCTRRSFVAMPEGWAMVHADRLHALEVMEEQFTEVAWLREAAAELGVALAASKKRRTVLQKENERLERQLAAALVVSKG